MFEYFTERARKIMSLARLRAQDSNSEFIGTEHMLLGILEEGGGVGYKALKALKIDFQSVKAVIEELVIRSSSPTVTIGQLPFSPCAKRSIELAQEEACRIGDLIGGDRKIVGTGALLLGIFRDDSSVGYQVLMKLGMNLDLLRSEVDKLEVQVKGNPSTATFVITKPEPQPFEKMRIRLFKMMPADRQGQTGPVLMLNGTAYAAAETIDVAGVSSDKREAIAANIASAHGAGVYILES